MKKILILEDQQDTRNNLADIITETGHEPLCAASVTTAETFLDLHTDIRAVILDYRIEGEEKDGSYLAHTMRKKYPKIPRLFFSSMTDLKSLSDMEFTDSDAIISKSEMNFAEKKSDFGKQLIAYIVAIEEKKAKEKEEILNLKDNHINIDSNGLSQIISIDSIKYFKSNKKKGSNTEEILIVTNDLEIAYKTNIGTFVSSLKQKSGDDFPFIAYDQSLYIHRSFSYAEIKENFEVNIDGLEFTSKRGIINRFKNRFFKIVTRKKKQ